MSYPDYHHKPCTCIGCTGTMWYSEIEDYDEHFNIHINRWWACNVCAEWIPSYDERFEEPE